MATAMLLLILCQLYLHFVEGSLEDVPLGHLKPFGEHTTPSAVEERYDLPSAQEFWEKYAKPLKPVVFRGINKQSPVFTKWTDEYLKENYGDMEMRIEVKREIVPKVPEGDKGLARDTLRNFINTYHSNTSKYVISDLPTPMYKDFLVPPFVGCGSFAERMVEADLWIGGGGASSKIHKDAFHIINCLFNGTKEWKMIETKHEKNIYKVKEETEGYGAFSHVNPMKVDLKKYPKIQKVPWSLVNVNPGDCLFIPRQMYHQVLSFGTHNLAISLLFSRFVKHETIDFSDCPASGFRPLSEFDPDWKYPGNGRYVMGRSDLVYGTKRELYQMTDEKGIINLRDIRNSLKSVETFRKHGRTDQEVDKLTEQFYAAFGKQVGDKITTEEIRSLQKESLRKINWLISESDNFGMPDYEYYYIPARSIIKLLAKILKNDTVLNKNEFIDTYVSRLDGTQKFGEEFFNNLGGDGKDSITKDLVLENINKAMDKYDEYELQHHKRSQYGQKDFPVQSTDYRSLLENAEKRGDASSKEGKVDLERDQDGLNSDEDDDETDIGDGTEEGEEEGGENDGSEGEGDDEDEDDGDSGEGNNDDGGGEENDDGGEEENDDGGEEENDDSGEEENDNSGEEENDNNRVEDDGNGRNGENDGSSNDSEKKPKDKAKNDKSDDLREKDEL